MSTVILATPVAVDPRDYARAARRSVAIAAPLMSVGAGLLLAALSFMDPSRADSVPRALAGGQIWVTADRLLLALGLSALTGAAVLAVMALRDRDARFHLGQHALSDGSYSLTAFVIGPWLLMSFGHYQVGASDWARPSPALVIVTVCLTLAGAALLGSSLKRHPAGSVR